MSRWPLITSVQCIMAIVKRLYGYKKKKILLSEAGTYAKYVPLCVVKLIDPMTQN